MSQVLALKYRPRRFEDLIGQGTISQTLSLALDSNRLSHAYLFSGLRGSGKTSTARIMSKALLCSNGPTSKPCDVCDNCKAANEYRHIDIIEMDAASNRGIDDIKELIEHTKYKPSSAKYKVFIIDEVHMLTPQAFNALLKTLEEPPAFVKFILATTDPLKLPATILSRTQHFRFKKISQRDVINHLSHILNLENIEFEKEALEVLSRSGQGSLRDTLTMLDQAIIFAKGRLTTGAVTDMLGLIDPAFMNHIFDLILNRGDINTILDQLEEYEAGLVIDEMTIYLRNKMLENDARFDILMYDRFFRILADAKQLLFLNSDSTFVLVLSFSKMVEATNLRTINEIINEVEKVEAKTNPVQMQETKSASLEVKKEETIIAKPVVETELNTQTQAQVISEPVVQEVQIQAISPGQTQVESTPVQQTQILQNNITTPQAQIIAEPIVSQQITPEPIIQETQIQTVQNEMPAQTIPTPQVQTVEEPIVQTPIEPVSIQTNTVVQDMTNEIAKVNTPEAMPQINNIEPQQEPISATIPAEPLTQMQNMPEPMIEHNAMVSEPLVSITLDKPIIEPINQMVQNHIVEPIKEEIPNEYMDKFNTVIKNIYERNYDLASCFEKNFFFEKLENDSLFIRSVAKDECKKLLWKEFSHIRIFIEEVFGSNIQIEFIKDLPQQR